MFIGPIPVTGFGIGHAPYSAVPSLFGNPDSSDYTWAEGSRVFLVSHDGSFETNLRVIASIADSEEYLRDFIAAVGLEPDPPYPTQTNY